MSEPATESDPRLHRAFLSAAVSSIDLLADPSVAEAWGFPSALPDMTVGALACHLGRQVAWVRTALTDPAVQVDEEPVPLLEHYKRSAWVGADLDDEVNLNIRGSDEQTASRLGAEGMLREAHEQLDDVQRLLAEADVPAAVRMPWWGWALTFDDFLVTRMMESAVHSDDLAVSIGAQPPQLPAEVLDPVFALLVGVATHRHGQAAVLRALSRAERAPQSIAAF